MKYLIEGQAYDTDRATGKWDESTFFDGHNRVSRATGSQWDHETLWRSGKGTYYIESESQWQGSRPSARLVTPEEAVRWLLVNDHELPGDLKPVADAVEEGPGGMTVTVSLTVEAANRLQAIAATRGTTPEELVRERILVAIAAEVEV